MTIPPALHTARIVARELVANASFFVPGFRALRVRQGRTMGGEDAAKKKFAPQLAELEPHLGDLTGAAVLELGPGEAVPLAWVCLQRGARRYVGVDRFGGNIHSDKAKRGYAHFGAPADFPEAHARAGSFLYLTRWVETLGPRDLPEPADLAFSVNTLEHVGDLEQTFAALFQLLRPGGRTVHIIDLGPHGDWRFHPDRLRFLALPGWLWHAMGSQRGTPNRVRKPELLALLRDAGFRIDACHDQQRFTEVELRRARPKLPRSIRELADDDLGSKSILVVATKPHDAPQ